MQSPGPPCLTADGGALGPLPHCDGLQGFPHPVSTSCSAPLSLVAHHHNEGNSGAFTSSVPPPRRFPPSLRGGGVSRFLIAGISGIPPPAALPLGGGWGQGGQLQYRGRGRRPSVRAAAPLIGRCRPPRERGHMRRWRRRQPQTLCGRADRGTDVRTEARALQRPPARARA